MRPIDADALNIDIDLSKGASVLDLALSVIKAVKEAPTADVVEVVRCKDCIHCKEEISQCGLYRCTALVHSQAVNADHFCSYGERREHERQAD